MWASPRGIAKRRVHAGHALQQDQRLLVAGEHVHVEEPRHDLVQGVEGRPHVVAAPEPVEELLGEGAQVAAAEGGLALRQLRHEEVAAGLHRAVAEARVEQRAGREVVAHEMAAQLVLRLLPAAQGLGRARQPGGDPEHVEKAVGIEAHHVAPVALHRLAEQDRDRAAPRTAGKGRARDGARRGSSGPGQTRSRPRAAESRRPGPGSRGVSRSPSSAPARERARSA